MKTVIMAGGRGTRIAEMAPDIPKPMIPLCGKPVLEYEIECLKRNGLTDIVIVVGHLGQQIKDYFGNGSKFGCELSYYTEEEPLGTAGALYKIIDTLTEDFILLNGDTVFDIDFQRFVSFHRRRDARASLAVHPNSHPHDSALLVTDAGDRIVTWLNKEDPREYYRNQVNAGLHILTRKLLEEMPQQSEKADLDRDILKPGVSSGKLFAYHTPEYIKDMGTPERYRQIASDMANGLVGSRNLTNPQKAIFLDRDGTINRPNGFIDRPEALTLAEGAAEAIRHINRTGYLAIVITNQPVIARGEVTPEGLTRIHNKMETELGKAGAFLDDLFYCPHHPDKGYPGERAEYKTDCNCRKPKPGLILQAAEKYNIDLSRSYMVGDELTDAQAGIAAGCIPVLLAEAPSCRTRETDGHQTAVYTNLKDFVEACLPVDG